MSGYLPIPTHGATTTSCSSDQLQLAPAPISQQLLTGSSTSETSSDSTMDNINHNHPDGLVATTPARMEEKHTMITEVIDSSEDDPSHPIRSFVHRLWLWEVAASVFSLACMAAIVGVLVYEHGRRLDEWGLGQAFLSPTVVVSFFGTLAKSSCLLVVTEVISQLKWLHFESRPQSLSDLHLFDKASRGPWGAFKLAFSKNRKALMASCASILMLASLLFDPFVQSVFRFPVVLTPIQNATASILASRDFDPTSLDLRYGQCYGAQGLNAKMQAAITTPVLNTTRAASLPCAFERCDWPTITTLGVCSSCINLTDTVVPTCVYNPVNAIRQIDCNYTVPYSNSTFNAKFGRAGGASVLTPLTTIWNSVAGNEWYSSFSDAWVGPDASGFHNSSPPAVLGNFTFIQISPDVYYEDYLIFNGTDGRLRIAPPIRQAMHCRLDLCARTFETPSFANSTASELSGPQVSLIASMNDSIFTNISVRIGSGRKMLMGLKPAGSPDQLPGDTVFRINYCDWYNMYSYLKKLFTATMSTAGYTGTTSDALESEETRDVPNLGVALSEVDDVAALMRQVADSMTEVIRTSPNSTAIDGQALSSVTYIDIAWLRLTLPLSVIVLSFLMLVIIISRNHLRGMPMWKSSSLAILFYKLEGWSDTEREMRGPDDLEDKAKRMKGQIMTAGSLAFAKAE